MADSAITTPLLTFTFNNFSAVPSCKRLTYFVRIAHFLLLLAFCVWTNGTSSNAYLMTASRQPLYPF